jgi:23S rRNA pseudouridine1911/1915/1917 synthase
MGGLIVFDDSDIVVINKPYNYAVHEAESWHGKTITNTLKSLGIKIKTSGPKIRMGVVQRLDVGTTGLFVMAKNEMSYINLKEQIKNREVQKKYKALLEGHIKPTFGTIDIPILRKSGTFKFMVHKDGKNAITHYDLIDYYKNFSYVDVGLETGRTHQIRVHFASMGHNLVGDTLYGANPITKKDLCLKRHFLHSYFLEFIHPQTNKKMKFTIDLPEDLQNVITQIKSE